MSVRSVEVIRRLSTSDASTVTGSKARSSRFAETCTRVGFVTASLELLFGERLADAAAGTDVRLGAEVRM